MRSIRNIWRIEPTESQQAKDRMRYILTHDSTDGTTGYFSCVPEPEPAPLDALNLLASRPNDSFLRRWLSAILADMEPAAFAALTAVAPATVAEFLADIGSPRSQDKCAESRRWRENISQHKPVAGRLQQTQQVEEMAGKMAARRNILAGFAARMQPRQTSPPPEPGQTLARAANALERAGILAGPEMRHEASLCPIALLREWQLAAGSHFGMPYLLSGRLTAYGRGLTLIQARISCLMEIVERTSAFATVDAEGCICGQELIYGSSCELGQKLLDLAAIRPRGGAGAIGLHWLAGEDAAGEAILVPCQAACLFLNLDEPDLSGSPGSTGLAAGSTVAQARLSALTEVIERDSHATTPFLPENCFVPQSRDPLLQSLFDDYRYRGIHVQMQDITTEIGVPCYRSFVTGRNGVIAQATGANLSGKKAALAAITETPWPYSWATGAWSPSARGLCDLPVRFLEDLPDYSMNDHATDLQLLEQTLMAMDLIPVYVDLTRPDLGIPVARAFVPGLEFDSEFEAGPSLRLLARYLEKNDE